MKKIILAQTFLLILFHSVAFCQTGNDAVTTAVANLKTLLTDHAREKAYLHFDRPYCFYTAGENVYFKAYVTMGERHEPTAISNVLHVDLIDKNDVLMQSASIQLTAGTGWGDFALPDTLQKGSYRIRAYTEWMRNDSHPYFFDQYLSVSSPNSGGSFADNTANGLKPDLQFFPEGGNMVADVPAKVAFKAIGPNGLGISLKGVIIDNEHKEVAKISTAHLGMGGFIFIPEAGKSYKAMVTFADGSQGSINLPAVEEKGITLSVNTDDPSKVSIEIRANRAYYKENLNKQLNLLVYYSGALKRFSPKLDNSRLGLDLPANSLPTGILKVSLLAETGEPMNERLVFIQNPDLLNLSISAGKAAFAARENVQLALNVKNKDGNPVNGSFSVSVVDESKILADENSGNSILSYLLLTSEVKGFIEKPNFYFANVTRETRTDLDMLMLSQGYRRFDWRELENARQPAMANSYGPEKGVDISGAFKTRQGAPIADCTVTLIPQAAAGAPQTQTTDKNGRFRFQNVYIMAGAKFILKTQSSSAKNAVLSLDQPAQGPVITMRNPLNAKYDESAGLLAPPQNNQRPGGATANTGQITPLKEVSINSVTTRDNYRSSNLGGAGHADQVVLGEEIRNASTLISGLNGRLHGVNFSGDVPYLQSAQSISFAGQSIEPMLIIVDGINLGLGAGINIINPVSVEAVEVLKGNNAAIYGIEGGQGVLVITTAQGGEKEETVSRQMSPGIFSIEPKGYYKAREFYSPRYDANQQAANIADNRNTIFWKPDVITDNSGNAAVNFFNAGSKGTYRVEVEGIDNQGNIGRQVYRYKVE